ncbi:histidine kinase [Nocardiopsis exhalans]|uniref:Histidine kinase n=1 Tax=Nocardiopsis exhalans TaxID=163604 RepID=A0ABY5D8I5_9ACTN|nr:MHYT domain-containing protein [Nocardiopsis exhalans]USY19421.1 histidine kinase [Nocardiopsis exhalans]
MIDHFAYGWWTPAIAYVLSVTGSFIGLRFALLSRDAAGAGRWLWLTLSAACLGGTAIWSMHFVAMMGFRVQGAPIRYDTTLTILSGLLAIGVMFVALTLATTRPTKPWIISGGLIAGAGVVGMHYMGMASMNVHGHLHHDPVYVGAACVIAVSAATTALWFALNVRRASYSLLAALLMGIAVSAMHYTGMFGMSFTAAEQVPLTPPPGANTSDLLLPLITGLFVFLMVCSLFLLLNAGEDNKSRHRDRNNVG